MVDDIRGLQQLVREVDLSPVIPEYVELVRRLRHAGIAISDRRAVKIQRILAASAILSGRLQVNQTDLWTLRYIWDNEEQIEILASVVQDAVDRATDEEKELSHIRAARGDAPDAEALAREVFVRSGVHLRTGPGQYGAPHSGVDRICAGRCGVA